MKKVLIVVARRYNGHELWTSLGVLQKSGVGFEVISSDKLIWDEVTGQANTIERTIDDVDNLPDDVDGLMVVSGNMKDTEAYWTNERVLRYVSEAYAADLPIAAICCSVPTIRSAAYKRRVSFFPLVRSRMLLGDAGAILSNLSMEVDGRLVTAENQMMSQMWATNYVAVLRGEEPALTLRESGFVAGRGRERKPIPEVERLKASRKTIVVPLDEGL